MFFHKSKSSLLGSVLLFMFPLAVFGQSVDPAELVTVEVGFAAKAAKPGQELPITITLQLREGWHINANKPLDEFLIPTRIDFPQQPGFTIEKIAYPPPVMAKFAFSETELAVYERQAVIHAFLKISPDFHGEQVQLDGRVHYQGCNDASCLQPVSKPFSATLAISPQNSGKAGFVTGAGQISQQPLLDFKPASNFSPDQTSSMNSVLVSQVLFSVDKVAIGARANAAIVVKITPGWHINANKPLDEFLIPTTIELDPSPGIRVEAPVYPEAEQQRFAFSDQPLAVYTDSVAVGVQFQVEKDFDGSEVVLSGRVHYQACNDIACMAPANAAFSGALTIAANGERAKATNAAFFDRINFAAVTPAASTKNEISGLIAEKGLGLALIFIFFGGLALNLTPCVYPLIPITISYFGGQAKGSTAKMFSLALVYILGMSITYSLLGVIAAIGGSLFGAFLQNPIVLIFVAAVMVALALSMFGIWELTLPQSLNQLAGGSRQGYFGSLFMGLTVGIVAAPCVGPFVLGLLTYVGTTADPLRGFWLFFVLSLGLGLPYLILGTFSGSIQALPRSGLWMIWVKKIFGFVLLGMAAYFLAPILPGLLAKYLLPAILLSAAVFIGLIDHTRAPSKYFPAIKLGIGIVFVVVAAWFAWPEANAHVDKWQVYSEDALAQAQKAQMPVIIDFSADWCIACRELEKYTFPSAPVLANADKFLLLRADLTQYASPSVESLKNQFDIKGLPTVIFLNRDGSEQKELRVIGFIPGEAFAQRMETVLGGHASQPETK